MVLSFIFATIILVFSWGRQCQGSKSPECPFMVDAGTWVDYHASNLFLGVVVGIIVYCVASLVGSRSKMEAALRVHCGVNLLFALLSSFAAAVSAWVFELLGRGWFEDRVDPVDIGVSAGAAFLIFVILSFDRRLIYHWDRKA